MSSNKHQQQRSSSNRIRTRAGTKAALAVQPEIDNEGIDAFGLTNLVGYEAEVNHCIGLCTATYSDYHFHMALASTHTYIYRNRSKHRLLYACKKGNVKWFQRLWKAGSIEDMIHLRYVKENLVYHLLINAREDRGEPGPDTLNRSAILRVLLASPIDMMEVYQRFSPSEGKFYWSGSLNLAISRQNYALAHELLHYPNRIDPNKPEQDPPIVHVARNDFWEIGIELAALPNVNLNATDSNHRTALQWAISHNNPTVIERVLLPHQDRINSKYMHAKDASGTALHTAVYRGYTALIPLLISFRNIDINCMHPQNGSPLVSALSYGRLDAARLLLAYQNRINVNLTNDKGETALALSCRRGSLDIVQTLLSFPNIDINTMNYLQRTPLHEAIWGLSFDIVNLLVQHPSKCNVNIQDKDGNTPLHLAIRIYVSTEEAKKQQLYAIVRILAAIPTIDFNLMNSDNYTVYDVAMGIGNPTILTELFKYKDRFATSLRQKYHL